MKERMKPLYIQLSLGVGPTLKPFSVSENSAVGLNHTIIAKTWDVTPLCDIRKDAHVKVEQYSALAEVAKEQCSGADHFFNDKKYLSNQRDWIGGE